MSVAGFRVDTDHVSQVVDDLGRVTMAVEQALADVDGLAAEMGGVWAGVAADAHRAAHAVWARDGAAMHTALVRLRSALEAAGANYGDAASVNVRMWD